MNNEVDRTIACIKELCTGEGVIELEEINDVDISDYMDLFPDDIPKIQKLYNFLCTPDINENVVVEDEEEDCSESESRKYNRMTKLDAENISKYIGEKCKGRADIPRIIDDVYNYINGKFGKATIRDLLSGRTFTAISGRFFRIKNGKIVAAK